MSIEHNGYKVTQDPSWNTLYRVQNIKKGGSMPTVLTGLYTTQSEAMKAIDLYKTSSKKG
jgi:hypothetical protein